MCGKKSRNTEIETGNKNEAERFRQPPPLSARCCAHIRGIMHRAWSTYLDPNAVQQIAHERPSSPAESVRFQAVFFYDIPSHFSLFNLTVGRRWITTSKLPLVISPRCLSQRSLSTVNTLVVQVLLSVPTLSPPRLRPPAICSQICLSNPQMSPSLPPQEPPSSLSPPVTTPH